MVSNRVNELIELLQYEWLKNSEMNLLAFLEKLATEAGFSDSLATLTDDILIYQLKMRKLAKNDPIPGLKKDHQDDFKTALLKARGVIKN